jgi:hypothetical protein
MGNAANGKQEKEPLWERCHAECSEASRRSLQDRFNSFVPSFAFACSLNFFAGSPESYY